jgi:hypothetical protein
MTRRTFSTTDLNQLHAQLIAWRQQQSGHTRLPETVWSAATALARTQGVSAVARKLHLDYHKLWHRLAGKSVPTVAPPTFVELQVAEPSGPTVGEVAVELSDGTGARMTLRWRSELPTLVALAETFWRRSR